MVPAWRFTPYVERHSNSGIFGTMKINDGDNLPKSRTAALRYQNQ